jgi:magnesium-transporting ATPase (P-type)
MVAYIQDDCRSENNEGSYVACAVVALALSAFWLFGRSWLRKRKSWEFVVAVSLSILLALVVSFSASWINLSEDWHGCDEPGVSLIR